MVVLRGCLLLSCLGECVEKRQSRWCSFLAACRAPHRVTVREMLVQSGPLRWAAAMGAAVRTTASSLLLRPSCVVVFATCSRSREQRQLQDSAVGGREAGWLAHESHSIPVPAAPPEEHFYIFTLHFLSDITTSYQSRWKKTMICRQRW